MPSEFASRVSDISSSCMVRAAFAFNCLSPQLIPSVCLDVVQGGLINYEAAELLRVRLHQAPLRAVALAPRLGPDRCRARQ
eukprot:9200579-Pyramimonas_sp.AAC.1